MARSEEDCLAHMLAAVRRSATRDRLIHGYFAVDLDIVWQIVKHDLPPVAEALFRLVPPGAESQDA